MNMNERLLEFSHPELNDQITAIGGSYFILKEARIRLDEDEVLYLVGAAIFDTSCCGAGGSAYALVPGFIRKWQYTTDKNGRPVSGVAPVFEERKRKKIREMIFKKESVLQVNFL